MHSLFRWISYHHTDNSKNKHTICMNRCSDGSVCLYWVAFFLSMTGICSSFHYPNTPCSVFSHFLSSWLAYSGEMPTQHTCWLRGDRWSTALLLYSFSDRDLSVQENYPLLLEMQHKGSKKKIIIGPNCSAQTNTCCVIIQ